MDQPINVNSAISQIEKKYGYDAMREIWIEELLELATILQQSKRYEKNISSHDLMSEIADVSFCIAQMKYLHGGFEIQVLEQEKIKRTIKRLL